MNTAIMRELESKDMVLESTNSVVSLLALDNVADTSLTSKLKVICRTWIILLFLDGEFEQPWSSFNISSNRRCLQSFQGVCKACFLLHHHLRAQLFVSNKFSCCI